VVTVMTNLGFRQAMAARGVTVVETAVGDRSVLEALDAGRYSLGGEQSGHVIFRDLATTGDGMLTGLLLADVVARSGRPLADLAGVMTRLPQVLVNVRLAHRRPGLLDDLGPDVAVAAAALGERGRVLVRPSGTEPLVRVMVEAPTDHEARAVAERLAAAVQRLGA
jgi:phosphoglucosamine mutase